VTTDVSIVFSIQDIDTLFDIDSTSHKVTKFIPIPTSSQPYPHHMPPFLLNPRATSRTHKYRPVNVMPCPRWELAARTIVPQDIACDRYLQNLSTVVLYKIVQESLRSRSTSTRYIHVQYVPFQCTPRQLLYIHVTSSPTYQIAVSHTIL
jgi:hypothetical protein